MTNILREFAAGNVLIKAKKVYSILFNRSKVKFSNKVILWPYGNNWGKGFLGVRTIGSDNKFYSMINLRKISGGNGYAVNSCRIVTDSEYEQYLQNLLQWQNILDEHFVNYYNFYE